MLIDLSHEIEQVTFLIAKNPSLFPEFEDKKGIWKVVIVKFNTLYYRISETNNIEISSFFQTGRILEE